MCVALEGDLPRHPPPTARVDPADLSGEATVLFYRASSKKEAAASGGAGSSLLGQSVCVTAPPDRNHTCVSVGLTARPPGVQIPALSFIACVTLDNLVNLSGSHSLALLPLKVVLRI